MSPNQILVSCPTCGHKISRRAHSCPKCNATYFECYLCKKGMHPEQGGLPRIGAEKMPIAVHESCLYPRLRLPKSLLCQDCHKPLEIQYLELARIKYGDSRPPCHHCGSAFPFAWYGFCSVCWRHIIPGIHGLAIPRSGGRLHDFCLEAMFPDMFKLATVIRGNYSTGVWDTNIYP